MSQIVLRVCICPGVEEELHTRQVPVLSGPAESRVSALVRQLDVRATRKQGLHSAGFIVLCS